MASQWFLTLFPLLAPLLAGRAERLYRQMPILPAAAACSLPSLSIIVPSRNEAHNLHRLLPTLNAASYPGSLEIIVVDDNSTDGTARIATAYGARVVRAAALPPGWLGKPYACHQGAASARGEWLLFTDADTVHAPRGPASAVAYACEHALDGLTLMLAQETRSWSSRAALLAAYTGLFAGLSTLDGVMYGQYILLHRSAYEGSGGFAAVRHEPLEDLALGHHLHKLGYQVPALRGKTAGRVQMYSHFTHLWTGLVRLGAGTLPWSRKGALVTVVFTAAAAAPVIAGGQSLLNGKRHRFALGTWLAVAAGAVPWALRLGSAWAALLAPSGAFLVMMAATWGLIQRLFGRGVGWKERVV